MGLGGRERGCARGGMNLSPQKRDAFCHLKYVERKGVPFAGCGCEG